MVLYVHYVYVCVCVLLRVTYIAVWYIVYRQTIKCGIVWQNKSLLSPPRTLSLLWWQLQSDEMLSLSFNWRIYYIRIYICVYLTRHVHNTDTELRILFMIFTHNFQSAQVMHHHLWRFYECNLWMRARGSGGR